MGETSAIEWTDATWNPTVGCTKVSPGCDHCYAETFVSRFAGTKGFPLPFDQMLLRGDDFLTLPLRWKEPRRIFVNSLSDLFHADIPDEFIAEVFAVMAAAPRHTFQLLTKRHARMRSLLSSARWAELLVQTAIWPDDLDPEQPLPNAWMGVSVEDQHWADIRIPALLDTPSAVRWISAEPLLGPVDLRRFMPVVPYEDSRETEPWGVDWIVVGGESGIGARPMHPAWARDLRDQCAEVGVPFLFKQWGEWRHAVEVDDAAVEREMEKAGTLRQWDRYSIASVDPDGTYTAERVPVVGVTASMMRTGKKAAGRLLDGRTHDGYPTAVPG